MIQVEDLAVEAGEFALEGISFEVPTGGYGVLMGATGCGKTTLLEALCGLRPIRRGRILLNNQDVTHLKPRERGIGYVPQDRALFAMLTVREHLAFALEVRRRPRAEIQARLAELAALLRLEHLLDRAPLFLSGGEKQRVALGRALAASPAVLCLDEPLTALDAETHGEMCELLRRVRASTGATILHVTHNPQEARALGDRILVLKDGRVSHFENGGQAGRE